MAYSDLILSHLPVGGSYWKLDETSGNVKDANKKHDGVAAGTPTYRQAGPLAYGSGELSYSIRTFTGNDGFDCGDAFEFTGTQSFTVECWVYPETRDASARYMMSQRSGGAEGWDWLINGTTALLFRRFQASATDDLTTATLPTLNAWSYMVVTYDGVSMTAYTNLVRVAGPTASAKSIQANAATFSLCGGNPGNLGGRLAHAAVYPGVVLTDAQRLAHYSAAVAGGAPASAFE